MRFQQNVACFNTVTALLYQLNDMETIFRLYNLGNLAGVLQVESYIGISGVQHTASRKLYFTATHGRATVLGVQTSQHGKAFALIDTVGILTQTPLYIFYFLQRNLGLLSDNLHLHLGRDIRNAVLRQILEVTAHLSRSYLNLTHQFLLHLLNLQSFTGILAQRFTNLAGSLVEVFLHFLARTDVGDVHVRHIVHTLDNLTLGYFDTIEGSLVKIQLLHGYLLRYHAIRVTVKFASFIQCTHACFFHFGLQYSLVTYYPHYLVNHVVLSINGRTD